MGSAAPTVAATERLLHGRPRHQLHLDTTQMAELMDSADLLIGCGGMTSWEACCLGVPVLIVAVAENQRHTVRTLTRAGAVIEVTHERTKDPECWRAALSSLAEASDKLSSLSRAAASVCCGEGASRVVDVLESQLRPMLASDAARLFRWRNSTHIRQACHSQSPLVWEAHVKWARRTLSRTDGVWRVYSEGGRELGHCNAVETSPACWRWSFYIGEEDAPAGAGSRMTSAFLAQLFGERQAEMVWGEVLCSNERSMRLHKRLGFALLDAAEAGSVVRSVAAGDGGAAGDELAKAATAFVRLELTSGAWFRTTRRL